MNKAINHLLFTTYNLPLTIYHLPFTIYHLPFTIYHLQLTIYNLQFTIYHLQLTIYHLPLKKMKNMKHIITLIVLSFQLSIINLANAQSLSEADKKAIIAQVKQELLDSLKTNPEIIENKPSKALTFSGYLEGYYTYDFGRPDNHNRPSFMYSHNRHNEININLGFIKAAYQTEKVRANLALAVGTYMNANYSAEPTVMKNIYEANLGVKISKKKDLWIDAGIMPSHIGFESAIGKDNWTVTRGLYAENSPYFNTGAKITYITDNGKWLVSGIVMNGWQRIYRPDGNNSLAFGHQITYKPSSKIILNRSSFVGNDKPDSIKQMRYFHNLYGQFHFNEKWALTAGFDVGAEQKSKGSEQYNAWYAPVLIAKYSPSTKHNIAARVEYYNDKNGVIIGTGTANGFHTWGYSINYDYLIASNVMWRIEARSLKSKDKIFTKASLPTQNNFTATTALTYSF